MSLGPVMMGLEGYELSSEERELLLLPALGGVILFTRNYESPAQLAALTRDIHALRDPPLLIAVDHEGGRVQRFRSGFTALPAVGRLGADASQEARQKIADDVERLAGPQAMGELFKVLAVLPRGVAVRPFAAAD